MEWLPLLLSFILGIVLSLPIVICMFHHGGRGRPPVQEDGNANCKPKKRNSRCLLGSLSLFN